MAERKPLFMSETEGYQQEMPVTDSITLGGLTMGGNINMQTVNRITNLPALPLAGRSMLTVLLKV
jgi:hypothetical protein